MKGGRGGERDDFFYVKLQIERQGCGATPIVADKLSFWSLRGRRRRTTTSTRRRRTRDMDRIRKYRENPLVGGMCISEEAWEDLEGRVGRWR